MFVLIFVTGTWGVGDPTNYAELCPDEPTVFKN